MKCSKCQTENLEKAKFCVECGQSLQCSQTAQTLWLQWALTHEGFYESYHNHKENMAWIITGFYAPGIVTFAGYLASSDVWFSWLLTVIVPLATFLVLVFIKMQFDRRWWAADTTNALVQVTALLANGELIVPSELKFDGSDSKWDQWPSFIADKIKQKQVPRIMREAVEDLISLRLRSLENRWKTELPSYGLVIISAVCAVNLIWRYFDVATWILRSFDSLLILVAIVSYARLRKKARTV